MASTGMNDAVAPKPRIPPCSTRRKRTLRSWSLIDDQDRKVRFLRVEHGGLLGFAATASFIPVDAISRITGADVYITQPRQHVADAPGYDPDLEDEMDYYGNIYGYYGY